MQEQKLFKRLNKREKRKARAKKMQKIANRVSLGAVHTHTHTQVRLRK